MLTKSFCKHLLNDYIHQQIFKKNIMSKHWLDTDPNFAPNLKVYISCEMNTPDISFAAFWVH